MQVLILLAGRETGAGLGHTGQFRVTYDAGIRIVAGEGLQQLVEGMLLCLGACIGGLAFLIQTTLVDYTKGTIIVVPCMYTLYALGEQGDNIAAAPDIVVIAALAVLGLATSYQHICAEGSVASVGYAVHNDEFDGF